MPPRFSLIIPAYNEERLLPRLLDSVDGARSAYADADSVEADSIEADSIEADSIEVIVADNMSTDRTAQIAAARGCRVVRVAKRVIAAARNGGAQVARGEILCFIDADSRVHPQTFVAIEAALAERRCIAGATGVSLDRWSPGIALTYALFLPLVWLSGLDAGVVFCRREDFDAVQGYDETRPVAEDVAFLWSLRRLGKTRGQKLKRVTRAKAIASTRKFDEFGDWHYFGLIGEALRQLRGRGGTELTDKYWYKPNR